MITPDQALSSLPSGLRDVLLAEFRSIVDNFMEGRWGAAELSGGRFCEVVYTILDGYAQGAYPPSPTKPSNFVQACRQLESYGSVPRSFQILIPRLLPALYEIRNNRNVGHVGGDVSPDLMDCSAVVAIASWILAEVIRVLHGAATQDAQRLVDNLAERRTRLVWKSGELRRVLDPSLPLKDQILVLVASCNSTVNADQLFEWTGYGNRGYFERLLRRLHSERLIEYHLASHEVELLPPGSDYVASLLGQSL
jgi:hypothetical protein